MAAKTPKKTPLAFLRETQDYAVEWEAVEGPAPDEAPATDLLGLTPADRAALGLSPPAEATLARPVEEDAGKALRAALR